MQGRDPEYRRQRERGRPDRAIVVLDGRRIHLGVYDTTESREKYHRLLAEWRARGGRPPVPESDLRVVELVDLYLEHADRYYRAPNGAPTGSTAGIRRAVQPLVELYGRSRTSCFGPRPLKAVRTAMIAAGLARKTVNKRIGMIKRIFRWGAAEELVDAAVYHKLQVVEGLRRGRTEAPERAPVRPVAQEDVDAIQPHVSRQVWGLIQLQLLTGARPGEAVVVRPCDIDTSEPVWIFTPPNHKNAHRGHERRIFIGPRAQAVLRPFLMRPAESYCFSPREAEDERYAARLAARKTPIGYGNAPGTNRVAKPQRKPGECYSTAAYGRAIAQACKNAGIARWGPNRLRHAVATEVRKRYGVELARALLGHGDVTTTQIYAEADAAKAMGIASKIG